MFLLPRIEGRICLSGLARQVSVLGAEKGAGSDNFCCGVRTARRGAKDEEWQKARQERTSWKRAQIQRKRQNRENSASTAEGNDGDQNTLATFARIPASSC